MFVNEELNNSKSNFSNSNLPLYFSPYIPKKKSIGNLYTEPRKIPIEKESSSNSRNKIKQKITNSIKLSNLNIKTQQDAFAKSLKLPSDKNKKGRNMHQSYIKLNTKLYLKKNAIPNLGSFNNNFPPTPLMKNSNTNIIMTNSIKSMEKNSNSSVGKNKNKNSNKNIKLIFGKGSSNNVNYNTNKNHNANSNSNLLKKNAGSANELFRNNFIKKTRTNNINDLNNQIGYILTTTGNNSTQSKTSFLSPQNISGQKIIFLKKDKNKMKDGKEKSRKNSTNSSNKDIKKSNQSKKNEKKLNVEDLKLNLDERNKSVQYLLRNTYNNVKIYPTTVLNNKIIYQENKKKEKMSHSVNNSTNSSIHSSTSKKKNDIKNKMNINLLNYKINRFQNSECQSVEEVHFLLVKTIHNGRNLIINMDRNFK